MVNKSPNWGYSPSKWPKWLINGGLLTTNYLLTGMILQAKVIGSVGYNPNIHHFEVGEISHLLSIDPNFRPGTS